MAKGRIIGRDIVLSPRFHRPGETARLAYLQAYAVSDKGRRDGDRGLLPGDPELLRATAFPLTGWSTRKVARITAELIASGLWIEREDVEGTPILQIYQFELYQSSTFLRTERGGSKFAELKPLRDGRDVPLDVPRDVPRDAPRDVPPNTDRRTEQEQEQEQEREQEHDRRPARPLAEDVEAVLRKGCVTASTLGAVAWSHVRDPCVLDSHAARALEKVAPARPGLHVHDELERLLCRFLAMPAEDARVQELIASWSRDRYKVNGALAVLSRLLDPRFTDTRTKIRAPLQYLGKAVQEAALELRTRRHEEVDRALDDEERIRHLEAMGRERPYDPRG